MNKTAKSSFAILKAEFKLQYITAASLLIFFAISMLWAKYSNNHEDELPKMLIIFYTAIFGFVLPWQTNTKGHIVPEYCRYNLNMPVHTWQLIILPLLNRFFLIFTFILGEVLIHGALYGFLNGRYIDIANMLYYTRISIAVYWILQAFAWSKDSFKNLFLWLGVAFAVSVIEIPRVIIRIFDADCIFIYYAFTAIMLVLTAFGVRNLRKGLIFTLPGLNTIENLFSRFEKPENKTFSSGEKAHFHQEWKRSWTIMPSIALGVIVTHYLISLNGGYNLMADLLSIFMVFAIITLSLPFIGIIVNNKCFKSSYVDNLPISSCSLAKVKLKSFFLSYTTSLGIFLLWILYKLFVDGRLLEAIRAYNQIIFNSPGVIIWLLATVMIWAFTSAFILISFALGHQTNISILLVIGGYFLFRKQIAQAFYPFLANLPPTYVLLCCFINILIVGKLCMAWMSEKNFIVKFTLILTAGALTASYTLIVCPQQYIYMLLLPSLLFFAYPLTALTRTIYKKRYEFSNAKPVISWQLTFIFLFVFLGISLYTGLLNRYQENELNKVLEQCLAESKKIPSSDSHPKQKLEDYFMQNAPYRDELFYQLDKLIKDIHSCDPEYKFVFNYYDIRRIINATVKQMLIEGKYEQALELTSFLIKTAIKYNRFSGPLDPRIYNIPSKEKSLLPKLKKIKQLLRQDIEQNLFYTQQLTLPDAKNDAVRDFILFNTSRHTRKYCKDDHIVGFYKFYRRFLSPLYLNDNINYFQSLLEVIKCVNFCQTGKNKPDLNKKLNVTFLYSSPIYFNVAGRNSLIALAVTQYRIQNGKMPESLNQLVPEYLREYELYNINNNFSPYPWKYSKSLVPVLKASSLKDIKAYMSLGMR